jgi:Na+/H+ antiporter NhaC
MIPLNAWGALVIGLISANGIEEPMQVFIHAIPFNLYPIIAILFAAIVILFDLELGPMRAAQERVAQNKPAREQHHLSNEGLYRDNDGDKARYMLLPIIVMVLSMPISLYLTGDGDIMQGSGSTSVLWAVLLALLASWILGLHSRKMSVDQLMQVFLKGSGEFLPIAVILLFALALGDIANLLGTGAYVAVLAQKALPLSLMLPLLFLISSVIAFSIGSSWGTFAIMIPLSIQISLSLGLAPAVFLAAVLSGAVFGDHASPISDTTVVASMASGTDHIEHVKTQLPYALLSATLATAGFYLVGVLSF